MATSRVRSRPGPATRPIIPAAGLLAGIWALLPPYVGPGLEVEARVEFADHVVPGVVVIGLSLAALAVTRRATARSDAASTFMFTAGLGVVLAGLWMSATHFPLVPQMLQGAAPVGSVIHHSSPGLVVLVLGIVWASAHRDAAGDAPAPPREKK